MPVALYTFGMFLKPADDPANRDFHALNDPILAAVDAAPGLVARSGYLSDGEGRSWGPEVYPRFHRDNGDGWAPATLSLWADLGSIFAFTYTGLHATAYRRGREWFQKPAWPPLVLWWHDDPTPPTWAEGVRRHEHLHDHGPTARAFTFKSPFDQNGAAIPLDKTRRQAMRARHVTPPPT